MQLEEPTHEEDYEEVKNFDYTKIILTLSRQFKCQHVVAKETDFQKERADRAYEEVTNLRTALELVTQERDTNAKENENLLRDLRDLQSQLTRKEAQNHELLKNEKKLKEQLKYEDASMVKLNLLPESHSESPQKATCSIWVSLVGDHSLYDSEIKAIPVKAQTDFVSCGWRCILHSEYILSALFRRKEQFMGKNTIQLCTDNFLSRYRACIIGNILEVSHAKTLDNAPMFLDIEDVELMLASGECGVPKEVTVEEREHKAVGDVQANPMEEMECTREEAEVTVPISGEDVPAANLTEINIDAPAVAAEVSSDTMEELRQTMEEPEVEISPESTGNVASNEQANSMEEVREAKEQPDLEIPPMHTHNVASNELATSMEEVETMREEPELGLPPMTEHMTQDISAGQEHPVAGTVVEEEGESKKEQPEVESETRYSPPKEPKHINKEDKQDQQSNVDDSGLDNGLQGSPQLHGAN
ncbi:hypothetical protein L7F22_047984 [Adiantum nelumboides]|nr:hypothetical protein [Adiantum nelumboides]